MEHAREMDVGTSTIKEDHTDELEPLLASDRSIPKWQFPLSLSFNVLSMICFCAVSVLAMLLDTMVGRAGQTDMALVLVTVGAALIAAFCILELTHLKAFTGQRRTREILAHRSHIVFAAMAIAAVSALHVFLGFAIFLALCVSAGIQFLAARFVQREPLWDFLPREAMPLLSGRDKTGMRLATTLPEVPNVTRSLRFASIGIAAIFSAAACSYLVALNVLTETALLPVVLLSTWVADVSTGFFKDHFFMHLTDFDRAAVVQTMRSDLDPAAEKGVDIAHLTVSDATGHQVLSDISFRIDGGTVTGLIGDSGDGKTLLLNAIADPFSLCDLSTSGKATLDGEDLWRKSSRLRHANVAFVPERPILLPASGADNLACFQNDEALIRGKKVLEQLVFSSELTEQICGAKNALLLPSGHAHALSLARAFLISPFLYLLDRPENGLTDKQIDSVTQRLLAEKRVGRMIMLASNNRRFLEICDRLIVLREGRIVDYGPAEQVQTRLSNGWARFIGARSLDSEDNLLRWIKSHFRRGPEETNKRRACRVASDMLTLSCISAAPGSTENVHFTFKHFEGHCVLRMEDSSPPFSSAQLKLAQEQAENSDLRADQSPLASIIQNTISHEASSSLENRVLEVQIQTFDPRKSKDK